MSSLNMKGPYELSDEKVDEKITEISPGNYALGYTKSDQTFIVKYVGRADNDVNDRVHDWTDEYEKFKFSYASSPKAAFEKECRNFHDFGGKKKLDNDRHPDRPDDSNWKCPRCDIFNE